MLQFGPEGRTGTDSKAPSFELWLDLDVAKKTHMQTYSSFSVGFKDCSLEFYNLEVRDLGFEIEITRIRVLELGL